LVRSREGPAVEPRRGFGFVHPAAKHVRRRQPERASDPAVGHGVEQVRLRWRVRAVQHVGDPAEGVGPFRTTGRVCVPQAGGDEVPRDGLAMHAVTVRQAEPGGDETDGIDGDSARFAFHGGEVRRHDAGRGGGDAERGRLFGL
jgi:hypothetical protein